MLAGLVVGMLAFVGVAAAHVEVAADPDVEGATNAVVTFSAEAENPTAGIKSIQIVLPDGLTNNDVSLNKAPDGWTFSPDATGYTVAGPAQPQGQAVEHSIIVTHLPDMPALMFKALVTYANGDVDRWIDEKTAANPNPDHPAPVLQLRASASAPEPAPSAVTASATSTNAAPASSASGGGAWLWLLLGLVVLVVVVVGIVLLLRRRRTSID